MIEKLEKYLDAGFTKEELINLGILKMEAPENAPEQEAQEAPPPEAQEAPESTLSTGINELLSEMHNTLKSMQAANIQNSRMPEESREKPEDILASLIYPSFNSKEKSK